MPEPNKVAYNSVIMFFFYLQLLNPDSYCVKGKQEIENIYNSPTVKQYVNQVQVRDNISKMPKTIFSVI